MSQGILSPVFLEARSAWEALASDGRIPLDWVDSPARAFGYHARVERDCPSCEAEGCAACGESGVQSDIVVRWERTPHDPKVCDLIGEDVSGMMTAEALAREVAHALEPWGVRIQPPCGWRFSPATNTSILCPAPFALVTRALEQESVGRASFWGAAWHQPWVERWVSCASLRRRVPDGFPAAGTLFQDLPDPFRPLVELLQLHITVFEVSPVRVGLARTVEGLGVPELRIGRSTVPSS